MENEIINETFIFHSEWIDDLADCDKSRFAMYCIDYGLKNKEPDGLSGFELAYWKRIKSHIDYDKTEYIKKSNSDNGKKGAQKRWAETDSNSQPIAKQEVSDRQLIATSCPSDSIMNNELLVMNSEYDNEYDNANERERGDKSPAPPKSQRFTPPTIDEVRAHVREKGYVFSPDVFWAFYNANGWKVGKNPMKNWHSACVTWQQRETAGKPPQEKRQCETDYGEDF